MTYRSIVVFTVIFLVFPTILAWPSPSSNPTSSGNHSNQGRPDPSPPPRGPPFSDRISRGPPIDSPTDNQHRGHYGHVDEGFSPIDQDEDRTTIVRIPPIGPADPPEQNKSRANVDESTPYPEDLPTFRWIHRDQPRSSFASDPPQLQIRFPSGELDRIVLRRHVPMPDLTDREIDDCLFLGRLSGEWHSSSAAVTGCPGDHEVQVTLISASKGHGQFLIRGNKVELIPSPWQDDPASPSPRSDAPSSEIHDEGWYCVEQDSLINVGHLQMAAQVSELCDNSGGCPIPKAHKLTVKTGYDKSLADKVDDPVAWIGRVLTHTQAFMYHPSLPSQITLVIQGVPRPSLDRTWTADASIGTLRPLTFGNPGTNLHAFFCNDPTYYGTVGIAYVGGLCDLNGYQVSLSEWRNTEAASGKVTAHEMGHNMGMSHDFAAQHKGRGCNGIMSYGNSLDLWSECSIDDFKAAYHLEIMKKGKHCMEVVDYDSSLVWEGTNNGNSSVVNTTTVVDGKNVTSGGGGVNGTLVSVNGTSSTAATVGSNSTWSAFCNSPNWRGDGYCDDENNSAQCGYDGGDCCGNSKKDWNYFCKRCECREPPKWLCVSPNWQGDGYCDDENNIKECGFDLGDCCKKKKENWNYFCKACECKE